MKKLVLIAVLAAFIPGSFLFAQQTASTHKESEYYYFNFPIEKIYAYRLGYIILYRAAENRIVRTYVPDSWFHDIGSVGEITYLGSGNAWPSMTVYYKSGKFSHVRLRLRRDRTHETWSMVPLNINVDEFFTGVEEVKLEF